MLNKDPKTRKDEIFQIIVHSYIQTAEPVGSKMVSKLYSVGLSPASIRNVMGELEEEGLIAQPHTSAGRVPTDRGYRYYVDHLMEPEELTEAERDWALSEISQARTLEGLVNKVSRVISHITGNTALIYIKDLKRISILSQLMEELIQAQRLSEYLEEEMGLFIDGAFRMFDQPEFHDIQKMKLFMRALDDKIRFIKILMNDLEEEGVQIHIGRENNLGDLDDVSVVVKDCYFGQTPIGGVAVAGPMRMRYAKIVPLVEYVADSVTEAVNRF